MPFEKRIAQGKSWIIRGEFFRSAALTTPRICSKLYLKPNHQKLSLLLRYLGWVYTMAASTP